MVFSASHLPSLRLEMVGFLSAGRTFRTAVEVLLLDVQHQADLAEGGDGAFEQHLDVFELAALPVVCP